ncbi:hypothetical protein TNIN_313621 [Trichonephila inaurata madagascariensis]|uniref:Uncharacterized protein n=1 Tax=Trichonephila inaurata madagascariensis TaxID=2747483 RepID=A0A8X6XWB2_9ARAC|nr:hypothetical protein TNIN_313621 [Trichonephila inaurata madagascariensis]
MPKRKSNFSKNTRKAKSQRLQLENESQKDKKSRLTNCRSQKSQESREQRLENNCIQHAASRSLESDDSREKRLEDDRFRQAASRSLESHDSREQRLEDDRFRQAVSRILESHDYREQRLEHDRIRHAVSLTLELFDSREKRVKSDRQQCDRYHESQGQRIEHLAQLRESVSAIRQAETNFDRERRLFTSRQTTSALRDIESEENRRQRLNNDQIRTNRQLWNKFKDHFMEDYIRDFKRHYPDADINAQLENFSNRVLFALQDVLLSIGGNTLPHYGLPSLQANDGIVENLNREYFKQSNFDPVELQHMIIRMNQD